MEVVEETKSKYNMDYIEKINNINKLSYNFDYKNRFIYCNYDDDSNLIIETSFLKVLKPIHFSNSKKKNLSKKYIILELTDQNNDNQDDYLLVLNKVHEISQYNIKKNSLSWFNTDFDDFTLDIKVRTPIDIQKDIKFIKFFINNDNVYNKIRGLDKNIYISSKIKFNGLKINSDHLVEEWEIINFITQEEYEVEFLNLENINDKSITEYLTENFINNEKIIDKIELKKNKKIENTLENLEENNESLDKNLEENNESLDKNFGNTNESLDKNLEENNKSL